MGGEDNKKTKQRTYQYKNTCKKYIQFFLTDFILTDYILGVFIVRF